jgi:hypothetical protein
MKSGNDWGQLGMSSSSYLIIFDTNILNVQHTKKGDFTRFYFNTTFSTIMDKIEQIDMYEYIKIGIPSVVWSECKKQKIEDYYAKRLEVEDKITKFHFPNLSITYSEDFKNLDYEKYIEDCILEYKEDIKKRMVPIVELDIPSVNKFHSIVNRAFKKIPPFEGKETKSDKGFKDALLWESIVEYKENNPEVGIILYSDDKIFNDVLRDEYRDKFKEDVLIFDKQKEHALLDEIEAIARKYDTTVFIPKEIDEQDKITEWIFSKDFMKQLLEFSEIFAQENSFMSLKAIKVQEIINLESYSEYENVQNQNLDITAILIYVMKDGHKFQSSIEIGLDISSYDETIFKIEGVYVLNEEEDNEIG